MPAEPLKIVLIRPPYRTGSYDPELQECLGIEMLAAVLRRAGYKVKLIDALLQNLNVDGIVRAAAEFQPDVVGFSLMSAGSLESTAAIAAGLQASLPTGVLMIAGGQLLTMDPQSLRACQPLQLALRGEGEWVLIDLLRRHQNGKSLSDLPGLVRLTTDQQLISNQSEPPLMPLDSLPFAARDFAEVLRRSGLPANVQGSRGCSGRCSFCATPIEYCTTTPSWRGRSPQNLVEEIVQLQRDFGFSIFNFVDDDFLGSMPLGWQRVEVFADEILRRNLKVAYGFQCRVMLAKPALLAKLYRSGLRYVFLGVESATPAVLRRFRKPTLPARALYAIAAWRNTGIVVEIGMIPFHPWTTFATLKADYEFLQQAGCLNLRTATNRLLIFPGTPIADELLDSGVTEVGPDGSMNWQFNSTPVAEFYQRLLWLLQPVQPVWTLAATALPSLLLTAAVAEEQVAQRALGKVQMVYNVLNKWVAKTAFACLDSCQKQLPGNDVVGLRTEAKKLAWLQIQELSHVSFGRLTTATIAEVAEIIEKM